MNRAYVHIVGMSTPYTQHPSVCALMNLDPGAHLFGSTLLPVLTYASETSAVRKQDEHAISVVQQGMERTMLAVEDELRRLSKIRDAVA
ncbi:unnamed protein product [Heligmosomoides polygyrus]|uniref:DUF5753 domain-containing protein n=1 Tax=Heligmosomoides polygyrus TaxID=6339 RepID=A0A183G7U8_HELPZ|nr:unnamed protein product [Heligmosomoides polygyrus]